MRVKSIPVSSLKQQQPEESSPPRYATRTRKKHKRLDSICERRYNQNHGESGRERDILAEAADIEEGRSEQPRRYNLNHGESGRESDILAEASDIEEGRSEWAGSVPRRYNLNHGESGRERDILAEAADSEEGRSEQDGSVPRRSSRVRKAPVILDVSPPLPKKRRRGGRGAGSRGERSVGFRYSGDKEEVGGNGRESSKDAEAVGVWNSRLRSRERTGSFDRKYSRKSRGRRRKLFEEEDRDGNGPERSMSEEVGVDVENKDEEEAGSPVEGMMNWVERVKGLEDLNDTEEVCELAKDEVGESIKGESDYIRDEHSEHAAEESEMGGVNSKDIDLNVMESVSVEEEETAIEVEQVPAAPQLESADIGNDDPVSKENEEVLHAVEEDNSSNDEKQRTQMLIDEIKGSSDGKEGNSPLSAEEKPLEKEKIQHQATHTSSTSFTIKGRRCGLCNGGTDGKPPKKLLLETGESDGEAYNGSSASEEPNYNIWDGFGDEPSWLGRLLGPINDRYGIAGIWVHQQCAVWSPEVYFAGLGRLKNVRAALCRGRALKCTRCGRPGATTGCRVDRCPKTYHLPCARSEGCIFDHRKFLIACVDHRHIFQPHGIKAAQRLRRMKARKMKLELWKSWNDASRKDIEAEEKWLENWGEDEEFIKRESKRLQRDLLRISPEYVGGAETEKDKLYPDWESVAGLQDVIRCMKEVVIIPLLYPDFFDNMGMTPPRGVLLHGHPGTGKTLVVRALIGSCGRGNKRIAYFARKGADCLGKYVGDAERQLRLLFQVAEKCQPSIIFFDEIDGLAPCRTKRQDQTHSSVVSTLLALMDGLKSRGSVVVIGATNRPDAVDPALRRPGRFDREIYFPLPSLDDRASILSLHTRSWPKPVSGFLLRWIAEKTGGFAGADLQALCTQAAMIALKRNFPLHEVLSAAGKNHSPSERISLPTFQVEERDWLAALSGSPPPCSLREAGTAATGMDSSPLPAHMIPCLLQPLSELLVSLSMNDRLWLSPSLSKAAIGIKNVVFSVLEKMEIPNNNWWPHVGNVLQETDVANEIEKQLSLSGIVSGQAISNRLASLRVPDDDNHVNGCTPVNYPLGDRILSPDLRSSIIKKTGYRLLISGSPRSGQRHLASSLLHGYKGNGDVHKVDLATISQEGHGDVVQGITRMLMKCYNASSSVVFMPRIDLWAVETDLQISGDETCSTDGKILARSETTVHSSQGRVAESVVQSGRGSGGGFKEEINDKDYVHSPSHAWTTFIEQTEAICVNTSLVILATSNIPHAALPSGVRQFFDGVDCNGQSAKLGHGVPRFSMQLEGRVYFDIMMQKSVAELSRNVVERFVQLMYQRSHVSMQTKGADLIRQPTESAKDSLDGAQSKDDPPPSMVPLPNKRNLKGKSSLMVALASFGYQILRYPHFAELCWVTSKLKEGPVADARGPWKGWPFNSCISRPVSSVGSAPGSSDVGEIKGKEGSILVRGIVAVGLLAYRGMYTSATEVSLQVREVLEYLVGQINSKVQAGKDRCRFVRILSQVSHLEDMVNSWAYSLQSLEQDVQAPAAQSMMQDAALSTNNHMADDFRVGEINDQPLSGGASEGACEVSTFENTVVPAPDKTTDNCLYACSEGAARQLDDLSREAPSHEESAFKENGENLPANGELARQSVIDYNRGDATTESNAVGEALGSCINGRSSMHSDGVALENPNTVPRDNPCVSEPMDGCSDEIHNQINDPSSQEHRNESLHPAPATVLADPPSSCQYRCCPLCLDLLYDAIRKLLVQKSGLDPSNCSVEDVHDAVSSVLVDLIAATSRMFSDNTNTNTGSGGMFLSEPAECTCTINPSMSSNTAWKQDSGLEGFVVNDGVLVSAGGHEDVVAPHCKFEKLCLCGLVGLVLALERGSVCLDG